MRRWQIGSTGGAACRRAASALGFGAHESRDSVGQRLVRACVREEKALDLVFCQEIEDTREDWGCAACVAILPVIVLLWDRSLQAVGSGCFRGSLCELCCRSGRSDISQWRSWFSKPRSESMAVLLRGDSKPLGVWACLLWSATRHKLSNVKRTFNSRHCLEMLQ